MRVVFALPISISCSLSLRPRVHCVHCAGPAAGNAGAAERSFGKWFGLHQNGEKEKVRGQAATYGNSPQDSSRSDWHERRYHKDQERRDQHNVCQNHGFACPEYREPHGRALFATFTAALSVASYYMHCVIDG